MADEFEDLNSRIPDFSAALSQRIAQKQGTTTPATPTTSATPNVDPYQLMLKRKEAEIAPIDPSTVKQWPEKDVKALQDYCERMGIVGFSCGRMHPIAALSMLKNQFGDDYSNVPLEERVPAGYEKLGSSGYGPSYPYGQAIQKKQILHG